MHNRHRWMVIAGALLLAAIVGAIAWNAGVSHGIETSGKVGDGPYRGFFFWPMWPFFLIFFWLLFFRAFRGHGRCAYERRMGHGERNENDPGRG